MIYKGVDYSDADRIGDRRRKPPGVRKVWQVSKIWELHEEITRRILLGQKNKDIAKSVGCSAQTVSNVRNSPVIQDKLALMRGARDAYTVDIARDIQEFAPIALELLKNTIEGKADAENASIALRARTAESWLDRAGHAPIRKEQHITAHLTGEEIAEIRDRAFGPQSPIAKNELEVEPVMDAEYKEASG